MGRERGGARLPFCYSRNVAREGSNIRSDGARDLTRLSKLLAFILRHRPEAIGLELEQRGGWVDLEALVRQINAHRRLPYALTRELVLELLRGPGQGRFELRGERIRARSGHSVRIVRVAAQPAPEFLFAGLPAAEREARVAGGALDITGLTLREDDGLFEPSELIVIEAGRAARRGVSFDPRGEGFTGDVVPLRYVPSLRPGYVREVSAGGVLVRGCGEAAEFALIRTLPRARASEPEDELAQAPEPLELVEDELELEPPPDIADARLAPDRRAGGERRQRDEPPPGGVERRRGESRRVRRRRRSARWAAQGRLELPKGKLEPGETIEDAALREVREEMGIDGELEVLAALSKNHYCFRTPDGSSVFKTVHYFLLGAAVEPTFSPRREEGIVSVEWWPGPRAIQQVAFPNLRPVLEQAWQHVMGADGR